MGMISFVLFYHTLAFLRQFSRNLVYDVLKVAVIFCVVGIKIETIDGGAHKQEFRLETLPFRTLPSYDEQRSAAERTPT